MRGYLVIEIVPKFDIIKKSHFIVEAFVDLPGAFQQFPKTGGKSETSRLQRRTRGYPVTRSRRPGSGLACYKTFDSPLTAERNKSANLVEALMKLNFNDLKVIR